MRYLAVALVVFGCGGEIGGGQEQEQEINTMMSEVIKAAGRDASIAISRIYETNGSGVRGAALFVGQPKAATKLYLIAGGLTTMVEHPAHIHVNPDCSNEGLAAGPHWAEDTKHDLLGTLKVNRRGLGHSVMSNDWTVGDGGPLDVLGHSIIVHGADKARIGCGVIDSLTVK